ncbi:nitronate monooxygenase family protein [Zoogloea sp.]|uniref:NAD(P)H-dependent flavin oxidoreductase n=1 Tax=Zoogloea sp. TaxID=49181 RepID=UPI0026383118|nr:nitronate monooxygenase family protein [Zoogloea sp.]MDD3352794.1 nitronate monooxygenase family protein [Zoogloea sp.]
MKDTRLTALLGIELPILQAPMAGVQGSALALAVCRAGGLGALPCAMLTPEMLRAELETLAAETTRPWNLNFFCHVPPAPAPARETHWRARLAPYYAEYDIDPAGIPAGPGRAPFSAALADLIEAWRPPVVSFHFGLPAPALLTRVKGWGARVLASATSVAEARWLEAHGADVIIAQGLEAGGHRGMFLETDLSTQLGSLALVPQVVQAVNVPVVAAGGIADAAGVAAALALGAAGVQVGTAYLLCPEATTSPLHRAALQGPEAAHTALTHLFTGRPARGIVNRLMRELGPMGAEPPAFPLATAAVTPLRTAAEARGSTDFTPLWCGQNAQGCQNIAAETLTRQLAGGLPRH